MKQLSFLFYNAPAYSAPS